MSQTCQVFMLSSVRNKKFSTSEIIKNTFTKHHKIQQQNPNYIFRIYVYAENSTDLNVINTNLYQNYEFGKNIDQNAVPQFFPNYFIKNNNDKDNQIFYETMIFYTPIVLLNNYSKLVEINKTLSEFYQTDIKNIVIFIADDSHELSKNSNTICDYFDFQQFHTLVDIVYTSPIAIKNGRIRYKKYQQQNLTIQHMEWNK